MLTGIAFPPKHSRILRKNNYEKRPCAAPPEPRRSSRCAGGAPAPPGPPGGLRRPWASAPKAAPRPAWLPAPRPRVTRRGRRTSWCANIPNTPCCPRFRQRLRGARGRPGRSSKAACSADRTALGAQDGAGGGSERPPSLAWGTPHRPCAEATGHPPSHRSRHRCRGRTLTPEKPQGKRPILADRALAQAPGATAGPGDSERAPRAPGASAPTGRRAQGDTRGPRGPWVHGGCRHTAPPPAWSPQTPRYLGAGSGHAPHVLREQCRR